VSLSAKRWRLIEPILDEALGLDREERQMFLDTSCGNDAELRDDIQRLLANDRPSDDLDGDPDIGGLSDYVAVAVDSRLGGKRHQGREPPIRTLGPYRVLREIGVGGMGRVYLAERADAEFQQTVAIKVMRPAANDPLAAVRFQIERQILATLSHPSIARVFDGGVAEDGNPYLVMEYIDGLPLLDYCRRHRLSLTARLRLFEDVCAAVEFAHRRLIVHRDLKPSNILVTEDGRPKLLDFGIAKLLDPGGLGVAPQMLTRTGVLPMTPEYAAPEQFSGAPVTTATDIYALGVILFELLTGRRPYSLTNRSASEIERIVCQQEPTRPSAAGEGASIRVETAPRRLRGDLDTIVLKALRKEPEHRYNSVGHLTADLERFRTGHPIEARPSTIRYRALKFARRHRLAVGGATLVAGLVIAFAFTLLDARARTLEERDHAELEATKAEEVAEFLVGLFEATDPEESRGEEITAGDLLRRGLERAAALDDQPLVRARLLRVIGSVYAKLGNYEKARPILQEVLAIQVRELGKADETVNSTRDRLADILREASDFDGAAELLRISLAARRAHGGEQSLEVAESLSRLGVLLDQKGDHGAAVSLLSQASTIGRRSLPPDDARLANYLQALGNALHGQGEYELAEADLREALSIYRSALDAWHPEVANCLNSLAILLMRVGRFEEADPYFQEALDIRRRVYGERHHLVAQSLNDRAAALDRSGNLPAAEVAYREALASYRTLLGDEHLAVAIVSNNLGLVLTQRGSPAEAEELHREALTIAEENLGADNRYVGTSLTGLANALYAQGNVTDAERLYRRGLAVARGLYEQKNPRIAWAATELGRLLVEQDRPDEARALLREAHTVFLDRLGAEHARTARAAAWLGATLEESGTRQEGSALLEAALATQERLFPATHPHLAETRGLLDDRAR